MHHNSNLGGRLRTSEENRMIHMNDYRSVSLYKSRVRCDHKSRTVRAGFSLYAWFWFHTQFWIEDPEQRRPYTFIMRDWIYPNMSWFLVITAVWVLGLFTWMTLSIMNCNVMHGLGCLALSLFSAMLWAHLCWGGGWKQGEQEWPPYLG